MQDPHVVALIYRLVPGPDIEYVEAPPATVDGPDFRVLIAGGKARFEMRGHHPTRQSAQAVVAPFINAWEVAVGLDSRPGDLQIAFEDAEIIDRQPPPTGTTVTQPRGGMVSLAELEVPSAIRRASYPPPPKNFAATPDVLVMYWRYELYRQGKDTLAAMAYFCLTVLEASVQGSRSRAARQYSIHKQLLDKLGKLTASKGGKEARKAEGAGAEFTQAEREWIESVTVKLIRRLGEHAAGRTPLPLLSLADLPALA